MELKAIELRLKNKVLFNGEVDTICEIGQANNGFCENNGYFNFDKGTVTPIELSEDILLKFPQFNSISTDGFPLFISGSFSFEISVEKQLLYIKDCGVKLRGLHHLQNIIKDLTQTELEINL